MNIVDIENQVKNCSKCKLCQNRTNAVTGYGSLTAKIIFVGEAPGKDEDLQAKPFVGRAGKFLDELLKSINLKRDDVYITNVVKCRPPNNRDPLPDEINECMEYLKKQLEIIKPLLIITLGRHSMNLFLPNLKISEVHGQPKRYQGISSSAKQVYLPLYHPAVALYNPNFRSILMKDFAKIPMILEMLNSKLYSHVTS